MRRAAATALSVALLVVPGTALAGQATTARPVVARAGDHTVSLADIRAKVRRAGATVVTMTEAAGGVLVEYRNPLGLIGYTWYDLPGGQGYPIPAGYFADVEALKGLGPEQVTLLDWGPSAVSSMWSFPFEYRCSRSSATAAFSCTMGRAYLPIGMSVRFGSKPNEVLDGLVLTMDGVELSFGPKAGQDAMFMADYVDIPPVRTSFDPTAHTFTLTFQDTAAGPDLGLPEGTNAFVRGVTLREQGKDLAVVLTVVPGVRYYTGDVESEGYVVPFLELRFDTVDKSGWDAL